VWATPAEVRTYSAYPEVDAKSDAELNALLDKAENFIKVFCCDDFSDADAEELANLKTVDCGLVELFVLGTGNAVFLATVLKTERIGEYGYTKQDVVSILGSASPTGDGYLDALLVSMRKCVTRAGPVMVIDGPSRHRRHRRRRWTFI
jgi:hypothetical protein